MKLDLFLELATPPGDSRSLEDVLEDTLAVVRAADRLGFDAVWLAEHHFLGDYCNAAAPDLLLAAARLCLRTGLWGKARSYLESVLALRPSPEAFQEYGKLLNQLGEIDAAADAFREGLDLVSEPSLPAIPDLSKPSPG